MICINKANLHCHNNMKFDVNDFYDFYNLYDFIILQHLYDLTDLDPKHISLCDRNIYFYFFNEKTRKNMRLQ